MCPQCAWVAQHCLSNWSQQSEKKLNCLTCFLLELSPPSVFILSASLPSHRCTFLLSTYKDQNTRACHSTPSTFSGTSDYISPYHTNTSQKNSLINRWVTAYKWSHLENYLSLIPYRWHFSVKLFLRCGQQWKCQIFLVCKTSPVFMIIFTLGIFVCMWVCVHVRSL